MPVHSVYVHIIAHCHQVPVHLVTHLHVQTIHISIHQSINAWEGHEHTCIYWNEILRTLLWMQFILCVSSSHCASCCSLWRFRHLLSLCEGSWCGSWYFHPDTWNKENSNKMQILPNNNNIFFLAPMQRDLNITHSNVQSILEVMCAECFDHKAKHSALTTPDLINE